MKTTFALLMTLISLSAAVQAQYLPLLAHAIEGMKVLLLAAIIILLTIQHRRLVKLEKKVDSMIKK